MKYMINNLATDEKPTRPNGQSVVLLSAVGGTYFKEERMLITRKYEETLQEYKERLIREVEMDRMSAEDAFDCYEEAYMQEVE